MWQCLGYTYLAPQGIYLEVIWLDYVVVLVLGTSILVSIMAEEFTFPTTAYKGLFPNTFPSICRFLDDRHSDWDEIESSWSLNLHFPDD